MSIKQIVQIIKKYPTRMIFFSWLNSPSGLHLLFVTLRNTTLCKTSLDEWSARSIDLYLKIPNNYKRQISMPAGGIRIQISWKRGTADSPFRLHGHWDRLAWYYTQIEYHFWELRCVSFFHCSLKTKQFLIPSLSITDIITDRMGLTLRNDGNCTYNIFNGCGKGVDWETWRKGK